MKFGKSIGSQQEGNLQLHYIDYKLLKRRIKDVVERQKEGELGEALTANTAFEAELATEIKQVNGCFSDRHQDLLQCIADLSDQLQAGNAEGFLATLKTGAQRLAEVLEQVDQLRKYAVWNAVGVVKILKKRRKQTGFGIEDSAAERAGWLSRQTFFSGSDFAELHAAIESVGHILVRSQHLAPTCKTTFESKEREHCPICLDVMTDKVELDCSHSFCWKCFVLGPIAFQPGEYRITQCPVCRKETSAAVKEEEEEDEEGEASLLGPGVSLCQPNTELTRFLQTYFPQEAKTTADREASFDGEAPGDEERGGDQEDIRDVVGQLVKALMEGQSAASGGASSSQEPAHASQAAASSSRGPDDFFLTLPQKSPQEKESLGQKLQWLQLAWNDDPMALENTMYCSLCWEPLLMEAVVTTPCKHHFHRVCVNRLELPECPLCNEDLPYSWFLPHDHPCVDHGFKCVAMLDYKPQFAGGPSRGSGGYPLHRPPPMALHCPDGLTMRSYLHRMAPMNGDEEDCEEEQQSLVGNYAPWRRPGQADRDGDEDGDSCSESSEEESGSEDGASPLAAAQRVFLHTALGRMRLCEPADGAAEAAGSERGSAGSVGKEQRNSKVLLIGDHL